MITDVKKYLILGAKEDLDLFYDRAQKAGCIEFISEDRRTKEVPEHIQLLLKAIKILKKFPPHSFCPGHWDPEETIHLAEKTVQMKLDIEMAKEEERVLEAEIARIAPLGDFSLKDVAYIEKEGKCKVQFFCIKSSKAESILKEEFVFHVGTFYDLEYFMTIHPKAIANPDLVEMRIDRSLEELKEQLSLVQDSMHRMEVDLKSLSCHLGYFQEVLEDELDRYHLGAAKSEVSFPLEGTSLFSVEAWIPSSKISKMFSMLSGLSIHCEQIQIEEHDFVPTVLENDGLPRVGEDLVRIYDLPSVKDKDPSGWVLGFFALFFAIIIADAGYGCLYLATAAYLKWKVKEFKGASKRLFRLLLVLSLSAITWGVLTCSYFGLSISPHSLIGELSPMKKIVTVKAQYHLQRHDEVYDEWVKALPKLSEAKTGAEFIVLGTKETSLGVKHVVYDSFADSMLLEISLLLGVIHIITSLVRYARRTWSHIGWIAFLVGGYLFFPTMLHVTSMVNFMGWIQPALAEEIGKELLYTGIGGALLLALIQNGWKGFSELTKVIEIFGDVLSYLRLYALALAGTILAETFNSMGEMAGLVFGFFIIILGHGVNIALGLMSGVIHGLRLNFIEWYRYSFEGGGRLFRPLMLLRSKDD